MKKSILCAICIGLFGLVMVFSGCTQTTLDYAERNISEVRHNIFEGATADYFVTFSSGQREQPYIIDGKSETKTNFGIISVLPRGALNPVSLEFSMTINAKFYTGQFERSPFDDTFAFDIGVTASDADDISVTIKRNADEQSADLSCISQAFSVKSDKALEIAVSEFETELKTLTDDGNISAEVYIKIISDADKTIGQYFWFVSFINSELAELSAIIDPMSGEVIAKKL